MVGLRHTLVHSFHLTDEAAVAMNDDESRAFFMGTFDQPSDKRNPNSNAPAVSPTQRLLPWTEQFASKQSRNDHEEKHGVQQSAGNSEGGQVFAGPSCLVFVPPAPDPDQCTLRWVSGVTLHSSSQGGDCTSDNTGDSAASSWHAAANSVIKDRNTWVTTARSKLEFGIVSRGQNGQLRTGARGVCVCVMLPPVPLPVL